MCTSLTKFILDVDVAVALVQRKVKVKVRYIQC